MTPLVGMGVGDSLRKVRSMPPSTDTIGLGDYLRWLRDLIKQVRQRLSPEP